MPGTVTTTEFYSSTDSGEAQPNGARSLTQAGSPASARAYRTELSPVSFLRRSAYVFPDKVAIVHGERRTTYREFDQRVNRLASALRAAGVEPGDRVAFLAPNIPALLEAHYGVPAAGAVLVAINTRLSRDEVAYILGHCGARMVFCDHEFVDLLDGIDLPVVRIDDTGAPEDPYEQFLAGGSPEHFEHAVVDEEDVISINYTSGTTGRPKGVMYTYRGTYLNSLMEGLQANLRPESVLLWVVPMFHCNGWCFPWAVTAIGGRHVCLRKVDPGAIWELIDREQVTHSNGAPTVWLGVVTRPRRAPPGARGHGHDRGRAAVTDTARADGRAQLQAGARLRADRDLRPLHRLRAAAGLAGARPTSSAPSCSAARACTTSSPTGSASSTSRCATFPPTARRWARS